MIILLKSMRMDKSSILVFLLFSNCIWGLQRSSRCGLPLSQRKIVGGVDSGGYRYPWFALLLLKKNSYLPVPVCAGSLITKFHVLTAAHCFAISPSVQNKDLYSVALGVYDICNESENTRQIFTIDSVAVHEKYQKRGKFYDIALIKLNSPADYTFICLPLLGVPDITEIAVIIGFGATSENSNFVPCRMLEVNVTKFSKKDCSSTKLPLEDKKEPSVICAGALTGKVDSCYGDSGGPLQIISSDGRYVIAGIVSYGYGCGVPEVPGVYTNVGSYIQWISNKISTLGGEESNTVKKKNKPDVIFQAEKGIRIKTKSTVTFPEQNESSNNEKSTVHYFNGKKPRFNYTVFHINDENGKIQRTKSSKVTFPK